LKLKFSILIFLVNLSVWCIAQNKSDTFSDLNEKFYPRFSFSEVSFSTEFFRKDSTGIIFENYEGQAIPELKMLVNSMYVFESEFYIEENIRNSKIALAVGAMDYPCQIFINGKYLASYGEIGDAYISKTQFSSKLELPGYLLNFGDSINKLSIQIYPHKGIKPALYKFFISSKQSVEKYIFRRNFIRIDLVKAASIFSIILFLYFLFSFIQNRDKKDKRYIIFAFLCIAFSLSYINISISYNSLNELLIYKIARASTPLLMYLVLLLTVKNTGYLDNKKLSWLLFIPILFFVIYLSVQPDIDRLEKAFSLFSIIVNFPYFLLIFILSLISVIKTRQRNKIAFFIGLIVVITTIISDTINYTSHINPYTWLIPLGFFSFLISIFFILSSEQTHIYHLSIDRQIELQKLKDNLELLVIERTQKIMHQKAEIEAQREEIEVQRDAVIEQKDEIEKQNHLLTDKNDEISEKNAILLQNKEEILTQIHNLEKLNIELEIQNKIIENQKLEIRQKLSDTIAKSVELKNENVKAQLKAIANQMNPHFIFNTLNAIKYFILKNDITTSDLYLEKFAKLMRCTLYNSLTDTILLKDEINTLTLYLELEQFRANKTFDFNINIEDVSILSYYKIPSLMIQPFIENSIIHGIKTLEVNGLINLDFKIEKEYLVCTIDDNGVGRQKSGEMKKQSKTEHKSVGISLISQRLNLMSELYHGNYSFEYIDMTETTTGKSGTKVILKLPVIE
jgi:hypothetical protein